ncbi:GATA transcription factor 27 isoform X2 [Raphanus sativus]|uniref:GATA transcription factor 27 isoform X2 n=1 Tax=Raphanus sativus TaxID=3726 RepID=A0A6J0JGT8_RAPSA|nr:GATA transcription factor 27 isoform X2 [Raphanus sativus]
MGKQGPCYHCGVTSTPLWRNGPPEKPVLCNACGSRWRTKGSLVNYTPLHARAEGDEVEIEDRRGQNKMMMINGMSMNKRIPKKKPHQENFTVKEFSNGFKKRALEEEASNNRSSSGSVVSNSESCDQSNAWEACKKRTCVGPRPKAASSVEKLTKDLFSILQEQQSSCLSGTSEEELLFENESPMVIGHGSVLMRDLHSGGGDEESEASSLLVERSKCSSIHSQNFGGKAIKQEQLKRTKSQVLGRHSLPLCNIDLKDVFNFDEFIEKFTKEEQQKLMKLLPEVDSVDLPHSLMSMFESSQFKENFSLFQQLVADGVFGTSSSSSGSKLEDSKTLAKLALSDPKKSHLLESYQMLKRKEIEESVTTTSRVSNPNTSDDNSLVSIERPCESLNQNFSETRVVMKSSKEVLKVRSKHMETKEIVENSVSSFSHMSYGGSVAFSYEDNDTSDQDLLVDVPSNGSYPQAELLHMI